jgi:group I intron endonuclease
MKNKRGIYKITNKMNNKNYIGESLDVKRRWDEHIEHLNNNKHHSYKLQQDWNKYGQDNFEFGVIALLDDEIKRLSDEYILLIYEDYYIKQYDSIENGYNVENTLQKVLLGEKQTHIGSNSKYNISIYQKQIEDKKIVNDNGLIYKPKYLGIKDLMKKLNTRRIDYKLISKKIIQKNPNEKYKYSLCGEYKDRDDIFLNNEQISKIRFTEQGLEFICSIFK